MAEDHVAMAQVFGIERLHAEALGEYAVDAVLLHPLEMPEDRFAIMRAEDVGHPAVLVAERRDEFLIVVQLAHIGPEIDAAGAGLELTSGGVMTPAPAGAVPWRSKPALVAAQHLASQSGAINAGRRRAIVGPHGRYHVRTAWRRLLSRSHQTAPEG